MTVILLDDELVGLPVGEEATDRLDTLASIPARATRGDLGAAG